MHPCQGMVEHQNAVENVNLNFEMAPLVELGTECTQFELLLIGNQVVEVLGMQAVVLGTRAVPLGLRGVPLGLPVATHRR